MSKRPVDSHLLKKILAFSADVFWVHECCKSAHFCIRLPSWIVTVEDWGEQLVAEGVGMKCTRGEGEGAGKRRFQVHSAPQ